MTATNTKSERPYHTSSDTRLRIKSSCLKNDTLADQSQIIDNEQAYFSNRIEMSLFGHKTMAISHDNFGLLLI